MKRDIVQSEKVFRGRVFDVRVDQVRKPDGGEKRIDVVEHNGAVALVPIDEESKYLLVRQYRHPAGEELLELPAGTLDQGEEPERCAVRECREEIGLRPRELIYLAGAFLAPGYSTEFLHYFLARDFVPDPLDPDEDETLILKSYTWTEVLAMISEGQIRDSKTLAGLFLAHLYLGADKD